MSFSLPSLSSTSFDYEVCKLKLGSGGSGSVFLAQHRQTKELVAVKRLFWNATADGTKAVSLSHYRPPSEPITPRGEGSFSNISAINGDEALTECAIMQQQSEPLQQQHEQNDEHQHANDEHEQDACKTMDDMVHWDRVGDAPLTHTQRPARPPCESMILQYLGPHPHIVKFLGSYTTSNRVTFVAMELMDSDLGRELRAANTTFMNEDVVRPLLYGIISAIAHLHKRGIAHCDIKPSNILLKSFPSPRNAEAVNNQPTGPFYATEMEEEDKKGSNHVKAFLGDFSAAHFTHEGEKNNSPRGTLYYKSPEQLICQAEDLFACDMWALGCTLFELVTGSVAFCGSTDLQVLHQIHAKLGTDFYHFPARVRESTLFDSLSAPSQALLELLQGLLALDPRERLSANHVLHHAFFHPLQGTGMGSTEWTFPTRIRSAVRVDAAQYLFRSIVSTPTKRSRHVPMDGSICRSAQHCSVWSMSSMSASPTPSFSQRRFHNAHPHDSADFSRRRVSLQTGDGTTHGGTIGGSDENPSTVGPLVSPVFFAFSPATSVKTSRAGNVLSAAKPPQLPPVTHTTLGNLRTNMIFDRSCGLQREPRPVFTDETESPNWVVRKTLFESPQPIPRIRLGACGDKFADNADGETTPSNCSTPRMLLSTHDAPIPLKELFKNIPERCIASEEGQAKALFATEEGEV